MLVIEHAYCLALDKREQNWKRLSLQCRRIGVPFTPFLVGDGKTLSSYEYSYVDKKWDTSQWQYGQTELTKQRHMNAFAAQIEIIKLAKMQGHKNILFLEDDTTILYNRFNNLWPIVSDHVADDFDLLYLGWWQDEDNYLQIEDDYKVQPFVEVEKIQGFLGGLHSVLINHTMYDRLINLPQNDPIDSHINRTIGHNNIQSYLIKPKLTHVNTQWSYCEEACLERYTIDDDTAWH